MGIPVGTIYYECCLLWLKQIKEKRVYIDLRLGLHVFTNALPTFLIYKPLSSLWGSGQHMSRIHFTPQINKNVFFCFVFASNSIICIVTIPVPSSIVSKSSIKQFHTFSLILFQLLPIFLSFFRCRLKKHRFLHVFYSGE